MRPTEWWARPLGQWLGFDAAFRMEINRIEGKTDRIVKDPPCRVVVYRDDRFALDAIALAEAGLGLQLHQTLLLGTDFLTPAGVRSGWPP